MDKERERERRQCLGRTLCRRLSSLFRSQNPLFALPSTPLLPYQVGADQEAASLLHRGGAESGRRRRKRQVNDRTFSLLRCCPPSMDGDLVAPFLSFLASHSLSLSPSLPPSLLSETAPNAPSPAQPPTAAAPRRPRASQPLPVPCRRRRCWSRTSRPRCRARRATRRRSSRSPGTSRGWPPCSGRTRRP